MKKVCTIIFKKDQNLFYCNKMTDLLDNVQLIKVQDPVLSVNGEKQGYVIVQSAQNQAYQKVNASNSSINSFNFQILASGSQTVIDRKMFLSCVFNLQLTCADQGKLIITSGRDGLRAFPLSNSISTIQGFINGAQVTVQLSDTLKALQRYINFQQSQGYEYEGTPTYPDLYQSYSEAFGYISNPLGSSGDSPYGAHPTRGSYPIEIVSISNTAVNMNIFLCEEIMISPMHFTRGEAEGFVGVQNVQFIFNLKPNLLNTLWSRNETDNPFITSNISVVGFPVILYRTLAQNEVSVLGQPERPMWGLHNVQVYPTALPSMAPGQILTSISGTIQLASIPRRLFIYCVRSQNAESYIYPDTFTAISNLSITLGVNSNMLSGATQRQLYQIAVRNGLQMTWQQFSGFTSPNIQGTAGAFTGCGSVMCLYLPEDLVLFNPSYVTAGVNEVTNLQVQITHQNISPFTVNGYELRVIVDTEGIFYTHNLIAGSNLSVITRQEVLQNHPDMIVSYESVKKDYGGDIWGDISSFVKNIPHHLETAAKFVGEDVLPIAKKVIELLPLLGLGLVELNPGNTGGVSIGPIGGAKKGRKKRGHKGGIYSGGELITQDELRNRLMQGIEDDERFRS